jgi:hypothetical protein
VTGFAQAFATLTRIIVWWSLLPMWSKHRVMPIRAEWCRAVAICLSLTIRACDARE